MLHKVQKFRDSGTSDMGTPTDRAIKTARFHMGGAPYVLAYVRAKFGGGTYSATLTLSVDSDDPSAFDTDNSSGLYDWTIASWDEMGTGGESDMYFPIAQHEFHLYTFNGDEHLVFVWANPDDTDQRWAIEVGLIPLT